MVEADIERGGLRGSGEYDFVAHLTRFCRALREHGLLVGPQETADAIQAVEQAGLMSEARIYWSLRALLVSRREQFPTFDRLFAQFWNLEPVSPRPDMNGGPKTSFGQTRTVGRLPRGLGVPEDDPYSKDTVIQLLRTGASAHQTTGGRDLSSLAEGEDAAEIQRIAARMVRALASRPGRRRKRHRRRGVPDLRGAMRLSLATGGDAVRLPRLRRVHRTPRLLLLLDVSGSMDRHARLMLRLAHAVGQQTGRVETFAFSTAITRITRALSAPNFDEALYRAGRAVEHWSGGTKIGESLRAVNTLYEHLEDRFTTVFLLSDGWETGDTAGLARELSRMRLRVRSLVWLNPLAGTEDFEPLARGLQAAMPYVDHFVPAGDVEGLRRLPGMLRG
ncbi:MAG: VWA domain-containing protein [Dehalococcoidia bacterium]|nr:VWA domain-containing protein [Dehalococcoidia bacterium]